MTPTVRVLTFNVLHPVHGQNYDELPMRSEHYDEPTRVAALITFLGHIIDAHRDEELLLIALQEVSERARAALLALALARGVHATSCKVARQAKLKPGKCRAGYTDAVGAAGADEYEMLLAFSPETLGATHCAVFENDAGKGFCALEAPESGVLFVSTHVSYGEKRHAQFAALGAYAQAYVDTHDDSICVVAGDFNCAHGALRAGMPGAMVLTPQCASRIGVIGTGLLVSADTPSHVVVVSRMAIECPVVRVYETDTAMLSDHRPVEAILEF